MNEYKFNNIWPYHGICGSCTTFPYSLWKCNFCYWKTRNKNDVDNYKDKFEKK